MDTGAKYKILIVDDSEMNRMLLSTILEDDYEIVEAENGEQAVELLRQNYFAFSLVLLDIVMPKMDGFEVLACMKRYHWIDNVPVIIISAENTPDYIGKAYELGATDYIGKPFDAMIVQRRVVNTIHLYAKQRRLAQFAADQFLEREKSSTMMVLILSHIVEFRNGESGLHILHVNTITELLLRQLMSKTDRYHLTEEDVERISMASTLHDIGKISIDSAILNKPGRLTNEEFQIMKTHSAVGASMLDELPLYKDEPLVRTGYEICRWHHERYDGRGYPDGLKGDEIPVSAQVVSMADVYDALTSKRCYKAAFSPEKAMEMILAGECGTFNPLLLECLKEIEDQLIEELQGGFNDDRRWKRKLRTMDTIMENEELSEMRQIMGQLQYEQECTNYFNSMSEELFFCYSRTPLVLTLTHRFAEQLGVPEMIATPADSELLSEAVGEDTLHRISERALDSTLKEPDFSFLCTVRLDGEYKQCQCQCHAVWADADKPCCVGVMGRMQVQ